MTGSEGTGVRADGQLSTLVSLVAGGGVVVLSGAGLSTESGIPDYRGVTGAATRRYTPMTFQAFVRDPDARRRFWARSHLGWEIMADAQPNAGHLGVAQLQRSGLVTGVITQNVDGLHSVAGSVGVIDLHGRLDRVVCLQCGDISERRQLQARLAAANTGWAGASGPLRPDGDVEAAEAAVADFVVVDCLVCQGVLKPDVVYFGESVPAPRVALASAAVAEARSLLVLGSSLTVYSGRRFVIAAAQRGIPVVIINDGPTRGDEYATLKFETPLGATVKSVLLQLAAGHV